jgi:prophage tail gpP-like protein
MPVSPRFRSRGERGWIHQLLPSTHPDVLLPGAAPAVPSGLADRVVAAPEPDAVRAAVQLDARAAAAGALRQAGEQLGVLVLQQLAGEVAAVDRHHDLAGPPLGQGVEAADHHRPLVETAIFWCMTSRRASRVASAWTP